jgi:hypothetical protein
MQLVKRWILIGGIMNQEEYLEEMLIKKYKSIKDDIYQNHRDQNQIYHFCIRVIGDLENYQKFCLDNKK